MNLPVVGFVSAPDLIFAIFLLVMFIYGVVRGLGRELRWLLPVIPAAVLTMYPPVHGHVSGWLTFLSPELAGAVAYVVAYYVALFVFQLIFSQIRPLREMDTRGVSSAALGGVSALLRGFMDCTMFIILASGLRLPWEALFKESKIADSIVSLWHQFGLLTELYATFTLNKFTAI